MARSGMTQPSRLLVRAKSAPALWPLLPLSWLFGLLAGLRRWLYRCGVLRSCR
jgi:tetraacyldisaccharide-1-P 4'-kinase